MKSAHRLLRSQRLERHLAAKPKSKKGKDSKKWKKERERLENERDPPELRLGVRDHAGPIEQRVSPARPVRDPPGLLPHDSAMLGGLDPAGGFNMFDDLTEARVVVPSECVGAPASHILVGSLLTLAVLLPILALLGRARERSRGRAADRALDPDAPLRSGLCLVGGAVELARGEGVAVQVRVRQRGTEQRTPGGGWSHSWRSVGREAIAKPFYLRQASGERVRVEPDAGVVVVSQSSRSERTGLHERTCIATVRAGDQVICEGLLGRSKDPEAPRGGGYRSSEQEGWVLRAAPGGRVRISSEPLGDRYRERARRFARVTGALVMISAITAMLLSPYLARVVAGEDTVARITHRRAPTSSSRRQSRPHYWVHLLVQTRGGHEYFSAAEVPQADYAAVRAQSPLAFIDVPGLRSVSILGRGSPVWIPAALLAALALLLGVSRLLAAGRAPRWYDDDLGHEELGRLPPA